MKYRQCTWCDRYFMPPFESYDDYCPPCAKKANEFLKTRKEEVEGPQSLESTTNREVSV